VNLLSESQVLFFVGVSGFIATMGAEHFSLVKFNRGFFVCLWVMLSLSCAAASYGSSRQKFEVKKHLNRLNKPPVKTIQSPDGDIIDCIPISKQPAFDHPFLKDHKIQMRPSYHPEGLFDDNKVSAEPKGKETHIPQLWHRYGKCTEGTIPMRRTREDDVLRASSVKRYGKKKHRSVPIPKSAEPDLINQNGHQVRDIKKCFIF
jgi:hypothetical protein